MTVQIIDYAQGINGADERVAVHVEEGRRGEGRHAERLFARVELIDDDQGVNGRDDAVVVDVERIQRVRQRRQAAGGDRRVEVPKDRQREMVAELGKYVVAQGAWGVLVE